MVIAAVIMHVSILRGIKDFAEVYVRNQLILPCDGIEAH